MTTPPEAVAADLEGTLTAGATWKGIGRYLRAHGQAGAYNAFFTLHLPGALLTLAGLVPKQRMQDLWMQNLARLLRGYSAGQLRHLAQWVVEHELWPQRRAAVVSELAAHRQAGRRVILTSGTYLPVLQVFAGRIGAEAIGTALEEQDGTLTGRLTGGRNTGAAKAAGLAEHLAGAALVAAYGDSYADVPMLAMSAAPVAVQPDPRLRRLAVARGWRVV